MLAASSILILFLQFFSIKYTASRIGSVNGALCIDECCSSTMPFSYIANNTDLKIHLGFDADATAEQILGEYYVEAYNAKDMVQQLADATAKLNGITVISPSDVEQLKETQSQVDDLAAKIYALPDEAKIVLGIGTDETTEDIINRIDEINTINADVEVDSETAENKLDKILQADYKNITLTLNTAPFYKQIESAQLKLDELAQRAGDIKIGQTYLPTTPTNKKGSTSGVPFLPFSRFQGTAHSSGNWGLAHNERNSLVGELGQELVATKDGNYYTVGDNGAEFVDLKKGDIIFNHKQTEQILKHGHINSRGKTIGHAEGTAHSNANGTMPWANEIRVNGNVVVNSTGSGSGSGSGGSSSAAANSAANAAQESTEEFLDWIEIKIQRVEDAISNLGVTVDSVYSAWSKRYSALDKQIQKTKEEIDIQQAGYQRYLQEANSVGLSEEYMKKVRDGLIDIEKITDETLKQQISDFQQWYISL